MNVIFFLFVPCHSCWYTTGVSFTK